MIRFQSAGDELHVLCLGAHPDDIEIGCGATMLALAERPGTTLRAVIMTGEGERAAETHSAMDDFFPGAAVEVLGFRDGRLPAQWDKVKDALELAAMDQHPDLIFAPRPDDAHQDHRLVGTLATTVWRDAPVLHYEIPKWDSDPTRPNCYIPVDSRHAERKFDVLDKHFVSQRGRDWWDRELFMGLLRIRGMECRERYAEAFTVNKLVVDLARGGK